MRRKIAVLFLTGILAAQGTLYAVAEGVSADGNVTAEILDTEVCGTKKMTEEEVTAIPEGVAEEELLEETGLEETESLRTEGQQAEKSEEEMSEEQETVIASDEEQTGTEQISEIFVEEVAEIIEPTAEISTDEETRGGSCGENVTWVLDEDTLTISGTGAMDSYAEYYYDDFGETYSWNITDAPWSEYKDEITEIVAEEGITSIGSGAFYCCTNLDSVALPSTLVTIGDCAFEDCQALVSVTIPSGVTSIGDCAFFLCQALTSVTIPSG